MKRRLLLVSNSTLHGSSYLDHCQQHISNFFGADVKRVLFVPYALHDRDTYTKTARDKFKTLGKLQENDLNVAKYHKDGTGKLFFMPSVFI